MPAVAHEMLLHRRQRRMNVHARNAAARAGQQTRLLFGKQDRRIMVFLHEARRGQSDHAGIPILARKHDRAVLQKIKRFKRRLRFLLNPVLDRLARAILLLQLRRQRLRARGIFAHQQLIRLPRGSQPPARVQPRRNPKCNIRG